MIEIKCSMERIVQHCLCDNVDKLKSVQGLLVYKIIAVQKIKTTSLEIFRDSELFAYFQHYFFQKYVIILIDFMYDTVITY